MFRFLLPAALGLSAQIAVAQDCVNRPFDASNCVRVLACIGQGGVIFDGRAIGWDTGTVSGFTNQGVMCAGRWRSGGFMGTGQAQMECEDGMTIAVLYYSQDSKTGTVIGRGTASDGREIRAWSGENVLRYLGRDGRIATHLPCGPVDVPMS